MVRPEREGRPVSRQIKKLLLVDIECSQEGQLASKWSHHPLGLMYIASAVRHVLPEMEIKIFHTATSVTPERDLLGLLLHYAPEVVGLRSLSLARDNFLNIAQLVRENSPTATIVSGGPYSSASYDEILLANAADIAVIGEGEVTFVAIIEALNRTDNGCWISDIPGTAVLADGQVKLNPKRPPIRNINSISRPAYDLINLSDYEGISNHAFQQADKCAFIESSRGCPYRCFYCHSSKETLMRNRTPASVVDEIVDIHERHGIHDFVFVDDIFNVPRKTGKETLRLLASRLPDARLNFPNGLRADQLDMEYLDLFEASGTSYMALAVESASPRIQKLIGKELKIDHAREMIHEASKRFIVSGFFMVGFPTETFSEAMETVKFAKELSFLAQPVLSILRVYQGTVLWDTLAPSVEQKQKLLPQTTKMFHPKHTENTEFYGDYFDSTLVPLKSPDIARIREMWASDVIFNGKRIVNSHKILAKYFNQEQMFGFYKNFFNRKKFRQEDLSDLLKFGDIH
jgi:radical SAM superfamily enzyme YgiQ (UPF0313 family)